MAIPDYQTLMQPLLELAGLGESSVLSVEAKLADRFGLSDAERQQLLPSGRQRVLHNRTHWAKFYLTKAGLLSSPRRGQFRITDAGRGLLAKPPPKLDTDWLLTIPAFKEFYDGDQEQVATGSSGPSIPEKGAATPEESIETAYHSLQSALKQELLDRVLQNSPAFFERVIVDLLSAMGYGGSQVDAASHLGKSGDGGVDGVINEDALGLDRVYVQANGTPVA